MENNKKFNTETASDLSVSAGSVRFFAGWQFTDDWVGGGTGASIEDAVEEYFKEHAEEEVYYACSGDGNSLHLEIWEAVNEKEAGRLGMAECWQDGWSFMLHKVVERREYKICISNGGHVSFLPWNPEDRRS